MERKKISLSGLGEVLTPQEMKNITGGSIWCTCFDCHGVDVSGWCASASMTFCEDNSCAGCGSTNGNRCSYV